MDAVDRTRILALLHYARGRRAAGLEISSADLAQRFRLDEFVVDRLLESEQGGAEGTPARSPNRAHPRTPTRELIPGVGSGPAE